jgi:hypothetical protein
VFCVLSYFTGAVFFTVINALPVTCSLRLIGLRVFVLLLHVARYCFVLSECSAPEHSYVSCDSDEPTTATAALIPIYIFLEKLFADFFLSFVNRYLLYDTV